MININVAEKLTSEHEQLTYYLCKIEALVNVALSDEFPDYSAETIQSYLSAIGHLLNETLLVNENALLLLRDTF